MVDFKLLLEQSKARKQAEIAKPAPILNTQATIKKELYGSGVTSRLIQGAEKTAQKTQKSNSWIEQLKKNSHKLDPIEKEKPDIKTIILPSSHIIASADQDLILDEYQTAAIEKLSYQKYGCLIGAAGTGKTTTTKRLVQIIEKTTGEINYQNAFREVTSEEPEKLAKNNFRVPAIAFCAYTGNAVQQVKKALPKQYHKNCFTIHSLLGFYRSDEEVDDGEGGFVNRMRFVPWFDEYRKLPWEVIIIDEASMVPIDLWNQLISACHNTTRIMMIGDINQLTPVQGRSVFGFAMANWPTAALQKIHRQAADNSIISNAHAILQGNKPTQTPQEFDLVNLNKADGAETLMKSLSIIRALYKNGKFDPIKDAIIVPANNHTLGQINFNERLSHFFNPKKLSPEGIVLNPRISIQTGMTHVLYAAGDKVMSLANNRDKNITNGMIGIITEINENGRYNQKREGAMNLDHNDKDVEIDLDADLDFGLLNNAMQDVVEERENQASKTEEKSEQSQRQSSHIVTVCFGDPETVMDFEHPRNSIVKFNTAGDFGNLAHAYAFTCHKSQGREYDTAIILMHSDNWRMLTREWLYTAVTRARKRVILIHNDKGLKQALGTQRIKGITVEQKMKSFIALESQDAVTKPILPKAKRIDE